MSETPAYDPASHYDRVTEAWRLLLGDELHYGVFARADAPLVEATAALTALMLEGAKLEPGLRVLDVGCGTGAPACQMAADHGVHVTGITTSSVGVADATERAAALGLSDLTSFEVRDGTNNGLPDATFDRVWVLESSHLMRDRAALVRECARVLVPGGRIVLCDLVRHREIPFEEVRERRADFATLREAFGDAHMAPLSTYRDLFSANGLEVERADDLTLATLPTFDRWRQNLADHRAEVVELIGEAGAAAFGRSTEILEAFWRDGTLGYGMLVGHRPT